MKLTKWRDSRVEAQTLGWLGDEIEPTSNKLTAAFVVTSALGIAFSFMILDDAASVSRQGLYDQFEPASIEVFLQDTEQVPPSAEAVIPTPTTTGP